MNYKKDFYYCELSKVSKALSLSLSHLTSALTMASLLKPTSASCFNESRNFFA